jgi:predicted nucleotidyltransferase
MVDNFVKTAALTEPLGRALASFAARIKAAFVFGSVAKRTDTAQSDIDLIVIGDALSYADLYAALQNAETALRRKVSPIFLSPAEWRRKASRKGSFISTMSAQPKIFIVGLEGDIKI